jgi:ferredoxin
MRSGGKEFSGLRIDVDPVLCEANAICVGMAPDVFDLDADENLQILADEIPDDRRQELIEIVGSCPRSALRVVDG